MRIFVLGIGQAGSLIAELLQRQGHTVRCGDRDVVRARRFLGRRSQIDVQSVNARNLWSIVRAARGCQLLVNSSPATYNEIILRAALRLRAHYLDLNSRLTKNPFKPEQLRYYRSFLSKRRTAIITAGVAPGLTNLLIKRGAEMLDARPGGHGIMESVHIRLLEDTQSDAPISTWSAEAAFDAAVSRPRVYRNSHFQLTKRFAEREKFRFPPPIGKVPVYLAAQDEVCTVPWFVPLREMDAKIGGKDIERLKRWYRQGKLSRSRGLVAKRFPKTPTPHLVAGLMRRGILQNARFAAALVITGLRKDQRLQLRWDCTFPTWRLIRFSGGRGTPIAFVTAHLAVMFVKHLPECPAGVFPPEALPEKVRRAVLAEARARGFQISLKIKKLRSVEEDEY